MPDQSLVFEFQFFIDMCSVQCYTVIVYTIHTNIAQNGGDSFGNNSK